MGITEEGDMNSKKCSLAWPFFYIFSHVQSIQGPCSDGCHPKNSPPHMFGICKSQDPKNFVVTESHHVPNDIQCSNICLEQDCAAIYYEKDSNICYLGVLVNKCQPVEGGIKVLTRNGKKRDLKSTPGLSCLQ